MTKSSSAAIPSASSSSSSSSSSLSSLSSSLSLSSLPLSSSPPPCCFSSSSFSSLSFSSSSAAAAAAASLSFPVLKVTTIPLIFQVQMQSVEPHSISYIYIWYLGLYYEWKVHVKIHMFLLSHVIMYNPFQSDIIGSCTFSRIMEIWTELNSFVQPWVR